MVDRMVWIIRTTRPPVSDVFVPSLQGCGRCTDRGNIICRRYSFAASWRHGPQRMKILSHLCHLICLELRSRVLAISAVQDTRRLQCHPDRGQLIRTRNDSLARAPITPGSTDGGRLCLGNSQCARRIVDHSRIKGCRSAEDTLQCHPSCSHSSPSSRSF